MKQLSSFGVMAPALLLAATVAVAQVHPAPAGTAGRAVTTTKAVSTYPASGSATHHSKHAARMASRERVDLNSATKDELMKLPGIGEKTAEKIIAARPFKTRAELVSKHLVTRSEYRKVRTSVTAKQS